MDEEKHGDAGASLSLGLDHVQAQVSEGVLQKFGDAVSWLFPKRNAKIKITAALAERVSTKIAAGGVLDSQELAFVSTVFEKEARSLTNREAAAERVQEVLPEVASQMRRLPHLNDRPVNKSFVARAENIASETADEEVREMFARVLAGEISSPGSISLRTLEAIRTFDRQLASAFDIARRLAFSNEIVFLETQNKIHELRGMTRSTIIELQDAGLIDPVNRHYGFTFGHENLVFQWEYQDRQLRALTLKTNGTTTINTSACRFTRVGQELAKVLPFSPDEEYFREWRNRLSQILGVSSSVEWKFINDSRWRSE